MPTKKKVQQVAQLTKKLSGSDFALLADYRGLTNAQIMQLRRQVRQSGGEVQVVKNTLVRLAAADAGRTALQPLVTGPTMLILGKGDPVGLIQALEDYRRTTRLTFPSKGGVLDGQSYGPEELRVLATLPPRDVLVAQLLGGLQAPISGLVGVLNGVLQSFAYLLEARRQQLEESPLDGSPLLPLPLERRSDTIATVST
jgi:large subunit ribosomal protein L10